MKRLVLPCKMVTSATRAATCGIEEGKPTPTSPARGTTAMAAITSAPERTRRTIHPSSQRRLTRRRSPSTVRVGKRPPSSMLSIGTTTPRTSRR